MPINSLDEPINLLRLAAVVLADYDII